MSTKPRRLDELAEFLPPAKGAAQPAPAAALTKPAPPIDEPEPPPLPAVVELRPAIVEKGQGRVARVQVSLRLNAERHDQLRRISYELHQPIQTIIETVLGMWMDNYDRRGRGQ